MKRDPKQFSSFTKQLSGELFTRALYSFLTSKMIVFIVSISFHILDFNPSFVYDNQKVLLIDFMATNPKTSLWDWLIIPASIIIALLRNSMAFLCYPALMLLFLYYKSPYLGLEFPWQPVLLIASAETVIALLMYTSTSFKSDIS